MKVFNIIPKLHLKFLLFYLHFVPFLFAEYTCEGSPPYETMDSPGSFTKCTYSRDLASPGFNNAVVYYPCEKDEGPYPASTLTAGWINTKEDIFWLAKHLVTHGYIIIAMTPNDNMGDNHQWKIAHKAGLKKLIDENSRLKSPIHGLVDIDNLQVMGFSKGGGGALLAAADLGTKVKSTQALAPFMDQQFELDGIQSATICYSGSEDLISSYSMVVDIVNSLPNDIDHTMAIFNKATHFDWLNDGNFQNRFKTYVIGWMKVYLKGDSSFSKNIVENRDWLYDFKHHNANGETYDGGCN